MNRSFNKELGTNETFRENVLFEKYLETSGHSQLQASKDIKESLGFSKTVLE